MFWRRKNTSSEPDPDFGVCLPKYNKARERGYSHAVSVYMSTESPVDDDDVNVCSGCINAYEAGKSIEEYLVLRDLGASNARALQALGYAGSLDATVANISFMIDRFSRALKSSLGPW
jgi:hypothetical protein